LPSTALAPESTVFRACHSVFPAACTSPLRCHASETTPSRCRPLVGQWTHRSARPSAKGCARRACPRGAPTASAPAQEACHERIFPLGWDARRLIEPRRAPNKRPNTLEATPPPSGARGTRARRATLNRGGPTCAPSVKGEETRRLKVSERRRPFGDAPGDAPLLRDEPPERVAVAVARGDARGGQRGGWGRVVLYRRVGSLVSRRQLRRTQAGVRVLHVPGMLHAPATMRTHARPSSAAAASGEASLKSRGPLSQESVS
jgi:hypothetical protein